MTQFTLQIHHSLLPNLTTTSFKLLPQRQRQKPQPITTCMTQSRDVKTGLFEVVCPDKKTYQFSTTKLTKTHKDKVVLIIGTTGTGKSRLSVDLATRFSGEIINSDKMQIYNGLEIATNLIPKHEQEGVPHHLLGVFNPQDGELTPTKFRSLATQSISKVISRGNLPIIVSGSNSFNYALLTEHFNPKIDPFSPHSIPSSISPELQYNCCILCVDVSEDVLFKYLCKRVDKMMELGLFEQLAAFYDPVVDAGPRFGVRKTIGVEEFDRYFRVYDPREERDKGVWGVERKAAYEEAVKKMKENTCKLVKKQKRKIVRLREIGWEIKKVDATMAIMEKLCGENGERSREIWEKDVVEESVEIVKRFLLED